MHDRGMIKWAPFNSVINSNYLVKEILKEKNKINKPILSDEQIEQLEKLIKESMINQTNLNFIIYQKGLTYNLSGIVIKVDYIKQKIYLDNHKYLYFCEIIQIKA